MSAYHIRQPAQPGEPVQPGLSVQTGSSSSRRFRLCALALAAVPSAIVVLGSNAYHAGSYLTGTSDALVFRVAAELLVLDQSPYDSQIRTHHQTATRLSGSQPPYDLPFAYPPHALPLFLLYLAGTPAVGYGVFVFCGTLLLLLATDRWAAMYCRRPFDQFMVVVLMGLGGVTLFNARLGQTGSYLAATVILFFVYYRSQPARAGILLGLMSFKPQYALLLAMVPIACREYKIILCAVAVFVGGSLFSGALFGFGMWHEFVLAVTRYNPTAEYMCNWLGLGITLGFGQPEQLSVLAIPIMCAAALTVLWAAHVLPARGMQPEMVLAGAIALAVIVSPNTHPYDLEIWLVPLGFCAAKRWPKHIWLVLAPLFVLFGYLPRPLMPLISLALLYYCLASTQRQSPSSSRRTCAKMPADVANHSFA